MVEGSPHAQKVPSDIAQIPIIWRYELLKYLRSRRLIASLAIAFVVIGLIYALPPLLGSEYSGSRTDQAISIERSPMGIPYQSIGTFNDTGVLPDTVKIFVNGIEVPRGSNTWVIAGVNGAPSLSRFFGTETIVLFVGNMSSSNVTSSYEWRVSAESFEGNFLGFANLLIVICATFFGADAIVGEYQNRTGYLMFPNPIKREALFFGKYSASMTAGIVVVGLFYGSIALLSLISAGGIDSNLGLSFAFALEYLLAIMAVAYFISTILKGTTGATVLTFFLFVMILPIIDQVLSISGVKPTGSVSFAAGVLQYITQNPYPVDASETFRRITLHTYYPDPTIAAITMLAYVVVAVVLSLVLFKRKELAG